jgi:hypothetical protein
MVIHTVYSYSNFLACVKPSRPNVNISTRISDNHYLFFVYRMSLFVAFSYHISLSAFDYSCLAESIISFLLHHNYTILKSLHKITKKNEIKC